MQRVIISHMKTGLIMEGGAMRGLFTAGVMDAFMANGITFDGAIGVSAGAAFGCNYKSRQIGRVLRYNLAYCRDWRYASFRSLLVTGDLYGGKFDYQTLPKKLDIWDVDTFRKNPMEFWCVATDAATGKALYHECSDGEENDLLWIQGSASMPMVSKCVSVDGYDLLDGGISDSIPLQYFESIGYDRNVVILTQPADYRKKPFTARTARVLKRALRKTPAVYETLLDRSEMYNKQVADVTEQEKAGNAFVIRPPENLNIKHVCHDPKELRRVYEIGKLVGEANAAAVREYLKRA